MRGRPPKPEEIRQGKAKRHLAVLTPVKRPAQKAPKGLLPSSYAIWRDYWASAVSQAADRGADRHLLERWILAVDEWTLVFAVFKKARLVKGSAGQPVLNPLAAYLNQLEVGIRNAETQLGLTPVARIRLGVAVGQARLTAEQLNRELGAGPVSAVETAEVEVEAWEGEAEWTTG